MPIVTRSGLAPDGTVHHFSFGKIEIPYISVSYGDNTEAEWVYVSGSQVPKYQSVGQYKPEDGSLKVTELVARTVVFPALPLVGGSQVIKAAVVSFYHPDIGSDSDALYMCRIMGAKTGSEAGSKPGEFEFKITYKEIGWTEKRKRFGNATGAGVRGQVRF